MEQGWVTDVIDFWFRHVGRNHWFYSNHEMDEEIGERFGPLWQSMRDDQAMFFLGSPRTALAAIILFDQLPRDMFRAASDSFATDPLALSIARQAIELGFDIGLNEDERHFIYMPFMHSETLADQDMSVELFDGLGKKEALQHAIMHRDVIKRHGRFPHRNAILGRENRPDELEALDQGFGW